MAIDKKREQELWVGFARDAMLRYEKPTDGVEDVEELVDDMSSVATTYADEMIDQYIKRYGGSAGRARRRRKDEEVEEEDEEDEDE